MQKAPIPAPAFLPAQLRTVRPWLLRGSSTSALLCRYSLGKHALPLGSFSSKPNSSLQSINKAISSASLEGKEMKKSEHASCALPTPQSPGGHVYTLSDLESSRRKGQLRWGPFWQLPCEHSMFFSPRTHLQRSIWQVSSCFKRLWERTRNYEVVIFSPHISTYLESNQILKTTALPAMQRCHLTRCTTEITFAIRLVA